MSTVTKPSYTVQEFMKGLKSRNPGEPVFHQAVEEFIESIIPFVNTSKKYQGRRILERLSEPDRIISFRVTWVDDNGDIQVNKGYRVQFNNAIGPYKGGLRFHPSVCQGILKFLGFEQVFKNSLTTLPMGGAKGGSDFNPKGKSDGEVMRFCQAFMNELYRHIGPNTDVPAGDIGVGGREVGYLFGQYKKLKNEFTGVLTGKALEFGGSRIRPEATGYGCVYFVQEMLKEKNDTLEGKKCNVSGSGNVAQYTAEKLIELGAIVQTMSDSNGTVYDKNGITKEKLEWIMDLKNKRRGRIKEYADEFGVIYMEKENPWSIPCDIAFPSATQNEVKEEDARNLVKNGCIAVGEGANMPTTNGAIGVFHEAKIMHAPGKASNAGGVAVSGLEMSQNSLRMAWTRKEVNDELHSIMKNIHHKCCHFGKKEGEDFIDYFKGANIAGFVKIADAVIAQGV